MPSLSSCASTISRAPPATTAEVVWIEVISTVPKPPSPSTVNRFSVMATTSSERASMSALAPTRAIALVLASMSRLTMTPVDSNPT